MSGEDSRFGWGELGVSIGVGWISGVFFMCIRVGVVGFCDCRSIRVVVK